MNDDLSLTATEDDDGERLDVVLGRHLDGVSRRVAKRLGLEGKLRIGDRAASPSTRVRAGDVLSVQIDRGVDPTHRHHPAPRVDVLSVDTDFVFVRKPAGQHTHALRPDEPPTLADAVATRFPECRDASADPREGGAAHRLDQHTSGVVCFARSREAWDWAREAFTVGSVHKRYLAVVPAISWPPPAPEGALMGWLDPVTEGTPSDTPADRRRHDAAVEALVCPDTNAADAAPPLPQLRVRAPLGRADDRRRVAVRLDGQRATTVVRVLQRRGPHMLVDLTLETGVRHQIRAHLAWIGAPLIGDARYGGASAGRLHLHAALLAFDERRDGSRPGPLASCGLPVGFWPPG